MKKFILGLIVGALVASTVAYYISSKTKLVYTEVLTATTENPSVSPVTSASPDPTPLPVLTPSPVINLKIGDKASYADWDYKVVKVETYSTIGDYTAKGICVVALVEFTNNAKMEREVGSGFIIKDSLERIFAMSTDASLNYHQSFKTEAWYLDAIGTTFTAAVPLAFDVAKDVNDLVLIPENYPDAPIFLMDKIN